MSQPNRPESSQTIYAQAVVRLENGDSLLSPSVFSVFIDSKNVSDFHVLEKRIQLVAQKLLEAGFDILDFGKMAITINISLDSLVSQYANRSAL